MAYSRSFKIILTWSLVGFLRICSGTTPGLIDIHQHIFPPEVPELQPDASFGINVTSISDHISFMDGLNITTSILMPSILKPFHDNLTAAQFLDLSKRALVAQLETVRSDPLRFGSFVMIPLPHVPESLEFLDVAMNGTLLPDGFALSTAMGNLYMGDPAFFPVFDRLNQINATVFIHPIDTVDPPELTFTGAVIEYPFDSTRCILDMMSTGVFTKFPNIRFIFAHNGGAFPFLADRIHYQREDVDVQAANNNQTIRDLLATGNIFFDTSQSAPFQWPVTLALGVPESHIVHGTDWPYTISRGAAPVGILAPNASGCFSEQRVKASIGRNNALDLLLPRVKAEFLRTFGESAISGEGLGTVAPKECGIVPLLEPLGI